MPVTVALTRSRDAAGRCGWRFPAHRRGTALVIVALLVAVSLTCVALGHRFDGELGDDGVVGWKGRQ